MSTPYQIYDKITSIDWNGQYFVLTARSEIADGVFSYAYSSDGQNWSTVQLGADLSVKNPYVAKSLGDKFIVAGNLVSTSSSKPCLLNIVDGDHHATIKTDFPSDTVVYDIEKSIEMPHHILFPKTTILALGNQIAMSSGEDIGNTWITGNSTLTSCKDAVWNGVHWVAVGQGVSGTISTSLDGLHWLNRGNYVFSVSCNGIDWSPQQNKFVAVGQGGPYVVARSYDGIYWKGINTDLFSVANDVKWNGAVWVAVGQGASGTIAYSSDGESWSYAASGFGTRGLRVHWNGEIWIAYGEDASYNVAKSADAISWEYEYVAGATYLSLGSANTHPDIPFPLANSSAEKYVHNQSNRGSVFIQPITVACGEGITALAYSVDGIRWSSANNGIFTRCNKATWNGVHWVAVGLGGIATSTDGIQWTPTGTQLFAECYDVAWNGHYFIAVGQGSTRIARSADGILWSAMSESVFSTRVHAIEWTGEVWLAYGSNGTAISADGGQTWTAKQLCITESTNLTGGTWTASSSQTPASNLADQSFSTKWSSATASYDASGFYVGATATTYGGSLTASGEWVQVELASPAICANYYVAFSSTDNVPYSFRLLGSSDGSTWTSLDAFSHSVWSVKPAKKYVLPLATDNSTAYLYYRLVFTRSFGEDSVSVSEIQLFSPSSGVMPTHTRPVILKDCVLHPTRIFNVDGSLNTVYRITDLSCVLVRDGFHGGNYTTNIMGASYNDVVGSVFNGEHHAVCSKNGSVAVLSNSGSLGSLEFDGSYNVQSGLSDIVAGCYNKKYVILGGAGGATYGVINAVSPPTFHPTNLGNLITSVRGLASNSGHGFVFCNNTIHLREDEQLSVSTPKYGGGIESSISFNVYGR
jgi:hypothetical protein